MELSIRQAEPQDSSALKQIIDLSFPRFFRFFALHSVSSEEGKLMVSEHDGSVVGFAKLTDFYVAQGKYGCILWLAVHPNYRREGIASALVKAGVEELKRSGAGAVFASAQRTNKGSLATFNREGFQRVGFVGLWRIFSWRIFHFYRSIWFAPGEIVLMQNLVL